MVVWHAFLSSADFFSKSTFSKNYFRNIIRVSNSMDPEQARLFVGPDLGPYWLQRLSADDTSGQRVNDVHSRFKRNILSEINILPYIPNHYIYCTN